MIKKIFAFIFNNISYLCPRKTWILKLAQLYYNKLIFQMQKKLPLKYKINDIYADL